jgi:hypothetical protein
MAPNITIDKLTAVKISGQADAEKIAEINAGAEIQADPGSLRSLPARDLTSANLHQIVALLGVAGELKIAAQNGGNFDIKILDRALAKTQLGLEDRIRVKVALLGSGFDGKAF